MKKYKLEILTPAWKEINEIANYHLYSVGVASSRKITTSILNALERLERFPFLCAYVPFLLLLICLIWFNGDNIIHNIVITIFIIAMVLIQLIYNYLKYKKMEAN